jgi:hypothetical protein
VAAGLLALLPSACRRRLLCGWHSTDTAQLASSANPTPMLSPEAEAICLTIQPAACSRAMCSATSKSKGALSHDAEHWRATVPRPRDPASQAALPA